MKNLNTYIDDNTMEDLVTHIKNFTYDEINGFFSTISKESRTKKTDLMISTILYLMNGGNKND